MRFSVVSILVATFVVHALQAAPLTRYKDQVFDSTRVTSNIVYGSNVNYTGASESLLLDLYQPFADTATARPLLLFIHGGAFVTGTKSDDDMVLFCQTFAKKGYVTASISYRLNPTLIMNQTYAAFGAEIVQAVQDAKAAVRFLRAHKGTYKLDDTKIMVGGTSAGGVTAVHYAYFDAPEVPASFDTVAVGGIEGASGTPGVSSSINGIINCWGAIGDSTWLFNANLPVISFHGTADNVVPFDAGYALGILISSCTAAPASTGS